MGEFGGRSHFSRIVLLGNLQGAVTEEELKRVFEKHGMVDEVISRDDYALIIMQDEDSVSKAVNALNDSTVWIQCKLKVAPLRERRNGGGNSDDGYGGSGHDRTSQMPQGEETVQTAGGIPDPFQFDFRLGKTSMRILVRIGAQRTILTEELALKVVSSQSCQARIDWTPGLAYIDEGNDLVGKIPVLGLLHCRLVVEGQCSSCMVEKEEEEESAQILVVPNNGLQGLPGA